MATTKAEIIAECESKKGNLYDFFEFAANWSRWEKQKAIKDKVRAIPVPEEALEAHNNFVSFLGLSGFLKYYDELKAKVSPEIFLLIRAAAGDYDIDGQVEETPEEKQANKEKHEEYEAGMRERAALHGRTQKDQRLIDYLEKFTEEEIIHHWNHRKEIYDKLDKEQEEISVASRKRFSDGEKVKTCFGEYGFVDISDEKRYKLATVQKGKNGPYWKRKRQFTLDGYYQDLSPVENKA